MNDNKLYLFKDKRFIHLFITQLCGCLNDNILKNALTILITYKMSHASIVPAHFLILIVNAIFTLPYIILAGIAGQLADKLEKSYLITIIKAVECLIVIIAILGFNNNSIMVLLLAICLMGVHSTFYGPLKYSMLSDHLNKHELLGANGYVEAGTFLAILVGTILGGLYNNGANLIILLMIVIAIVGFIASLFIPKSDNYNSSLIINRNILSETINIIKYSESKRNVFLAILGISWFWFLGSALLLQIPLLTKDIFYADENVANLFLAVFSIGVGVGSFWCNRLLNNEITTDYVFIAAIGISIFGIDLYFASRTSSAGLELTQLRSIIVFLSQAHNWRILFDLFAISAISGLYVVPLYAVMQYFTVPSYRSRVIAANNVMGAVFMCMSNILLSLLFKLGCTLPFMILFISLLNLVVAGYIYHFLPSVKIVPIVILKFILKFIFGKIYNVKVEGLENFHNAGPRAVIIANHISYLDPPLLATYLPENLIFAIHTHVAQEFWVRPFLKIVKAHSVDHSNAIAIKSLIREVKKNQKVVIFPEGRISTTGSLMKIYEGPGMIADRSNAVVLPIHIDGPQYTIFSKLGNQHKTRFFPKVKITVLPPVRLCPLPDLDLRQRRKYISHKLYDIMVDMVFKSTDYNQQLFQSFIDTAKQHGMSKLILQDIVNNNLTYRQCLIRSFLLGTLLSRVVVRDSYIGVMLPNSTNTTIALLACAAYGFVPAIINFTLGAGSIISLCRTIGINIICTSRLFIEKTGLEKLDAELRKSIKVIYLEDLRNELRVTTKIIGWLAGFFPQIYYDIIINNNTLPQSPAVILFTSGTENKPKAVVLSHSNLLANKGQVLATTDFLTSDVIFNALPMFHSFGLMTTIMPLLSGIRTFLYPSPLDYRIIPEMVYDIGATILFGTNTFLNNYAKYSHPYDFYSLRRVYAGAEKLCDDTCELWFQKHGIRIFEGYGATEASPVISGNTAMHYKSYTVGKMMPGIEYAILKVEGIQKGGKLCIKGPNVMLGYILADNPGVIVPPRVEGLGNGWYDTGDVVTIDEENYVTIVARIKRFAKIAGEMISLVLVEDIANNIDNSGNYAASYIEHKTRGEQIVLCTDNNNISAEKMLECITKMNISRLHLPKHIIYLPTIPMLPTGKVDYRSVDKIAHEKING